jgi:hypothetical protein
MPKWLALHTLPAVAATLWGISAFAGRHDLADAQVRERAEKVFAFERSHPKAIPAHEIRKLSLALEFHDHEGAAHLLQQLERAAGL